MLLVKAPLHSLRKTKIFRYLMTTTINKPKLCNLGFDHSVALRPLTHASILLGKNKLEPNIRKLTIKICLELKLKNLPICFLDVGANVGLYSWEVHKLQTKLKIFSFEPDPMNLELLNMTCERNNLQNIKIYPFALSNRSAHTGFFQDHLTSATGSISQKTSPWIEQYLNGKSKKITVETKKMDEIVGNDNHPGLVKIDVEGHEYEVIQGGLKTIKKYKPLMIIESFPPKQENITKILSEIGYKLLDADRHTSIDSQTTNLFAWHPKGSIEEASIEKLIN